jgi:hypothetical protein
MMRFAAALSLFLCFAAPAFAQMGVGPGAGVGGYGGSGGYGAQGGQGGMTPAGVPHTPKDDDEDRGPSKAEKPVEPPPAIPGAQPDEDAAVAPADRLAAEMSPNDALFDAISRGDLAAAKDALNRGAQLDAKNVLGQTPTDASIDLDRNDITFLLLSMRVSTAPSVRTVSATTPALPPVHGKRGRHGVVEASASAKGGAAATAVPSTDRGTPNPSVGFIGF